VKILYVVNAHEYTAAHRLPLLSGAKRAGYSILCAAPKDSPALRLLKDEGWTCHTMVLSRRGISILSESFSLREFVRLYKKVQPDLVHHATIKPILYGSIAARLTKVPAMVNAVTGLGYVYTGSGIQRRLLRWIVNTLYRVAFRHPNQRVIFQNRDDWDSLERFGAVRGKEAVIIPGSGVDIEHFRPAPEPTDEPVVICPARMLWDKGVGEFVDASRNLIAARVRCRFALVGGTDPGNPAAIPEEQLNHWVEEGVVEWWGPQQNMVPIYQSANLVVLPSYREGLPKVLIEASACQRAVVATNVPGCRDAVIDGKTGYLVPVRDSHSLAKRIDELVQNADLRFRMGVAGRQFAIDRFATDCVVKATLGVYEQLLKLDSR